MNTRLIATVALALLLGACAKSNSVPQVDDPHHPVVDGKAFSPKEFLQTFCKDAEKQDTTCINVSRAMSVDASKGAAPRF